MMINTLIFVVAVLSILVLMLIVMVFAMARQIGILFERITPIGAMINDAGPKIGDASPVFKMESINGFDVTIGGQQSHSTLVFFLSPTCPICNKLLPAIKSMRNSESRWLSVVLASDGELEKHLAFMRQHSMADIPYLLSQSLGTAYRVSRLPFAVLLDADGIVRAKGLVNSREQLDSLLNVADTGFTSIQDYASQTNRHDTFNTAQPTFTKGVSNV